MNRCKARTIIVLITGVSILTLFCGSIFACILPDMEKEAGTMARCPGDSDKRGDENKNVCSPTEFAQSQNHIKLPQDIKEINGSAFLDLDQALYPARAILIQRIVDISFSKRILQKIDIFIEYQNLRL